MSDLFWTKLNGEIVDHQYLLDRAKKLPSYRAPYGKKALIKRLNNPDFIRGCNGMLASAVIRYANDSAWMES